MGSDARQQFDEIAEELAPEGVEPGSLFGKPCLKAAGKSFSCFFKESMVFKLEGDAFERAISLSNASLFDPSASGRPMRQWVQVPFEHRAQWLRLAREARRSIVRSK